MEIHHLDQITKKNGIDSEYYHRVLQINCM